MDSSPTGSPVPGILQARTMEWVAISFSNVWKWKVKVKSLSHVRLLVTPWTEAYQAPPFMGFSRQEYWSGVPLPSLGEQYGDSTKKLKIELPYNPAISLLGIYLKKIIIWKDTCTPMFTAALFTVAKTWKQPYVSINRWMDRESEKILLSHKKEWNNTICSHTDRPRDYHSKWNQLETKINNIWFHLHVESKKKKVQMKLFTK